MKTKDNIQNIENNFIENEKNEDEITQNQENLNIGTNYPDEKNDNENDDYPFYNFDKQDS